MLYLPVAGCTALITFFMGTPAALVYFSTFWSKQPRVGLLWQFSNVGNVGTEKYLESVSETFLQMFRNDLGVTVWIAFLLLITLYLFFNLRNRIYTVFLLPVIVISLYISKFERSPSHYFLFLIPLYLPVLADFIRHVVLRLRKTLPSLARVRLYKLALLVVLLPSIYLSVYTSLINMRKDTRVLAYRWFTENIAENAYPVYVYGEPLEPIVFQQKKSERLKRVDTDYIKELPAILIIGADGVTESVLKSTDYEPREISGSSGKVLRNATLLYSVENKLRTGPPVLIYRIDSFTTAYGN